MVNRLSCFGPVVRQNIMAVGVYSRGGCCPLGSHEAKAEEGGRGQEQCHTFKGSLLQIGPTITSQKPIKL
jgi:hypothetical protein